MSNVFKVVDRVKKEALRIAHEKLSFIGTVDRQYDASFKYDGNKGPSRRQWSTVPGNWSRTGNRPWPTL